MERAAWEEISRAEVGEKNPHLHLLGTKFNLNTWVSKAVSQSGGTFRKRRKMRSGDWGGRIYQQKSSEKETRRSVAILRKKIPSFRLFRMVQGRE